MGASVQVEPTRFLSQLCMTSAGIVQSIKRCRHGPSSSAINMSFAVFSTYSSSPIYTRSAAPSCGTLILLCTYALHAIPRSRTETLSPQAPCMRSTSTTPALARLRPCLTWRIELVNHPEHCCAANLNFPRKIIDGAYTACIQCTDNSIPLSRTRFLDPLHPIRVPSVWSLQVVSPTMCARNQPPSTAVACATASWPPAHILAGSWPPINAARLWVVWCDFRLFFFPPFHTRPLRRIEMCFCLTAQCITCILF